MTMSPQELFAANLRRTRTKAGISQERLGELCELHRTEISLLERAGREPRLATLIKLAGALETTPAELCTGIAWDASKRRFTVKPPPRAA
jgi:transcriptional regulator with XRE-family HTH domain